MHPPPHHNKKHEEKLDELLVSSDRLLASAKVDQFRCMKIFAPAAKAKAKAKAKEILHGDMPSPSSLGSTTTPGSGDDGLTPTE